MAYGDGFGRTGRMHLDFCKVQIKLIINGRKQRIAFHNVKTSKDIKYRLVVSLVNAGDHVEVLNFICTVSNIVLPLTHHTI